MEASINNNRKDLWIETYSEPSETSKMEHFAKMADCIQPLTIFEKHFILDVSQCYEYSSDKLNKILVRCHLFNKIIGLQPLQFLHFQIQIYLHIIALP